MTPQKYPWLVPSNVSRDAKYRIRGGDDGWEVQLEFRVSGRERWLLTTNNDDALVKMVNDVKVAVNGQPGGAFYINEFHHVVVPAGEGCWYAGEYPKVLEFDFDGDVISPRAPAGLKAGDPWPGPRAAVAYTLMANGRDIKGEIKEGRRRIEVRLSDDVGESAAAQLAGRLTRHKGQGGGRIYINECGEFFGPSGDGEHIYFGHLEEDLWFTPPDVPGRA